MDQSKETYEYDCGEKISRALTVESPYTVKNDTVSRWFGGKAAFISNEEIKAHARAGHFRDYDYYVLQTIDEMGFATIKDIYDRIRFLARMKVRRRFPGFTSIQDLKVYILSLARRGVVYYYRYAKHKEAIEEIFYVTKEGFLLYSSQLILLKTHYEETLTYKTAFDIFKNLSANRALSAFSRSPICTDISFRQQQSYKYGKYTRQDKFYGIATCEDGEKKHHFIIEPVKFSVPSVITYEENVERVKYRLSILRAMMNEYSSNFGDNELALVIFMVEGTQGMRELIKLIRDDDDRNFWLTYGYITSDVVIWDAFWGDIYNSTLGMVPVGVNIAIEQRRPSIDLKIPIMWQRLDK